MVADQSTDASEVTRRTTLVVASGTVALLSFAWVATYLVMQPRLTGLLRFAGLVRANVDGRQRAAGTRDQLLDLQFRLGEKGGTALVEDHASLVERD